MQTSFLKHVYKSYINVLIKALVR